MKELNRTQYAKKNIYVGVISKLVLALLTFISRKIFLSILSADYLGIQGTFSDILMMLSMADMGFGTAMAYSFYKPLADHDTEKIAALKNFYQHIYNVIAVAVAIIGVMLVPFLKLIINVEADIPNITLYYLVFLANTVVSYLFVYKSTIIISDQKSYIISSYGIWINISKIVVQTIILLLTHNYLIYICFNVIFTIINNVLISACADRLYPYIKKKVHLSKPERKDITKNMISIFLYKVSCVLLNGTDNIIMSIIVGTIYVGYYSNYLTITNTISGFIAILFSSLTASIGNLVLKESEERRYEVFEIMQMICFCITIVCTSGLYILVNDFIQLWLGTQFILDRFAVIAIVMNFYLAMTMNPIWSYREATALYLKTKYIMLVAVLINIVLSVILGKFYGVGGILLASVFAKLFTYVWYEPKLLYKYYFKKNVVSYYFNQIFNVALLALVILLIHAATSCLKGASIKVFIVKFIIGCVISIVICFLRYCKTHEFKYLIQHWK